MEQQRLHISLAAVPLCCLATHPSSFSSLLCVLLWCVWVAAPSHYLNTFDAVCSLATPATSAGWLWESTLLCRCPLVERRVRPTISIQPCEVVTLAACIFLGWLATDLDVFIVSERKEHYIIYAAAEYASGPTLPTTPNSLQR
jgi:hypothetical protein